MNCEFTFVTQFLGHFLPISDHVFYHKFLNLDFSIDFLAVLKNF